MDRLIRRLVTDPEVTDLLINGDGSVWVERCGSLVRSDEQLSLIHI